MDNKTTYDNEKTEQLFRRDLHSYLTSTGQVDERLPEAPDLEELWPKLAQSYMPDGVREFTAYPTASLGWMMYIGMAVAKYWDEDWALYSKVEDLYKYLRDRIDFDHMDEYILRQVLLLTPEAEHKVNDTVASVPHEPTTPSCTCTLSQARPKPSAPMLPPSISSTSWAWLWNLTRWAIT